MADDPYCTTRGQGSLPAVCPSILQQSQQDCMSVAVNDFVAAAAAAAALHFILQQCNDGLTDLTMTLTASCKSCN